MKSNSHCLYRQQTAANVFFPFLLFNLIRQVGRCKVTSTGGGKQINHDKTILQKQVPTADLFRRGEKLEPDVSLQLKSPLALIILTWGVDFTSAL